jgi:alkanesulfonate monooxygenase SsuD/methylene tetrahydromethanopterin reductase-like flavin-dependent oxidoreductase (luciferase family)
LPLFTISDFPAKGNTLTIRQIADLAGQAEQAGAARFGITDFPYYYDCIPAMTACLAATETLAVECLVTTPYARHPEATACSFATMGDFSGGRAILGIGGGVEEPSSVWMEPWGHERPRPVRAVRELTDLCRTMWAGQPTSTSGQVLRGSGMALRFAVGHRIPILLAARGEQMLRLAGEIADIVHIAAPYLGDSYISGAINHIAEGARRGGRAIGDFEIDLTVSSCVMADGDLARSLAKITTGAGILWMTGADRYAQQRPNWSVPDELDVPDELVTALVRDWNMWSGAALPEHCAKLMDDAVLNQFSVAGTPEECIGRLVDLTRQYPQITGLRLKLPPLSGPDSADHYREMIRGVSEVIRAWPDATT